MNLTQENWQLFKPFWGISHPTGYPFFAIIGYIFSKIPLPLNTIFRAKSSLCYLEFINGGISDKNSKIHIGKY